MLEYKLKLDNTYYLSIDNEGYYDIHGLVPNYFDGLPISEVNFNIVGRNVDIGIFVLGDNVKKFEISFDKYTFVTIRNLIIGKSLEEFSNQRNFSINKIECHNSINYEMINGHLFNKLTGTVEFEVKNNDLALPNDPRIKCLDYFVDTKEQATNIYIGSEVNKITSKVFYNEFIYVVYVEKDNKNFKIIKDCLIDINDDTLLKQLSSRQLPRNLFSKIRGNFVYSYKLDEDYNHDMPKIVIPQNVKEISGTNIVSNLVGSITFPDDIEIKEKMLIQAQKVIINKVKHPENLMLDVGELYTSIDIYNKLDDDLNAIDVIFSDNDKEITRTIDSDVLFFKKGRYEANESYMVDKLTHTLVYYNDNSVIKEKITNVLDTAFDNFDDKVLILPCGIKRLHLVSGERQYIREENNENGFKLICNQDLESLEGHLPNMVGYVYLNQELKHIDEGFFPKYNNVPIVVSPKNKKYKNSMCSLYEKQDNKEICYWINDNFFKSESIESGEVKLFDKHIIYNSYDGPLKDIKCEPIISPYNDHFKMYDDYLSRDNEAILFKGIALPVDPKIDTIVGLNSNNYYAKRILKDCHHLKITKNIKNIEGLLKDLETRSCINNIRVVSNNPYFKKKQGCLIDINNKCIISVDDKFKVPFDGSVTSIRYSPGLNFNYAVFPSFFEIDERFLKAYKIFKTKDKTILTRRKRKGDNIEQRLYY